MGRAPEPNPTPEREKSEEQTTRKRVPNEKKGCGRIRTPSRLTNRPIPTSLLRCYGIALVMISAGDDLTRVLVVDQTTIVGQQPTQVAVHVLLDSKANHRQPRNSTSSPRRSSPSKVTVSPVQTNPHPAVVEGQIQVALDTVGREQRVAAVEGDDVGLVAQRLCRGRRGRREVEVFTLFLLLTIPVTEVDALASRRGRRVPRRW
jgi:hypothetical protein